MKKVDYNLPNIQFMVWLQHVQPTWEQVKDNQFLENSQILQSKELMKKNWKRLPNNLDFKQEDVEVNILLWIRKEQLIFLHLPDLELQKQVLARDSMKVWLNYMRSKHKQEKNDMNEFKYKNYRIQCIF